MNSRRHHAYSTTSRLYRHLTIPIRLRSQESRGSQGSIESKHAGGPPPPLAPALAAEGSERMESALGDALLRLLRIRKGPKNGGLDLDAVCITISRLGQPFLWLTWILQDCNTTQYLGFRERRGVQSSLHPSAMGELFCFRPFIPLDVQGRERQ